MSLHPEPTGPIPEDTKHVAQAAFPRGNVYMTLRDELGVLYRDEDFTHLFPSRGQAAYAPWRLALITVMQFMENLTDRQTANAVRARIDWKYCLSLELTNAGFDFSVLSEFRTRFVQSDAEGLLLEKMLERFKAKGLVKARGKQRTDSTHVLAAVRAVNRLELVGETLRAALNELATVAPEWLRDIVSETWFERYSQRIDDFRLPSSQTERDALAHTIGVDGFALLNALNANKTLASLGALPQVETLRLVWTQHYQHEKGQVHLRDGSKLPAAAERIASPYDTDARLGAKHSTRWSGYKVHLTESCEDDEVHLITHIETTPAVVQDVSCTKSIQQALAHKGLPPSQHWVDAGYMNGDLLIESRQQGISLLGPMRPDPSWQGRTEGAYDLSLFKVDWEAKQVTCPEGNVATNWTPQVDRAGRESISVWFKQKDCAVCKARVCCTRAKVQPRHLKLRPQPQHEALKAARAWFETKEGKQQYQRRAGIEGTLSQGIRTQGLRRTRYRGLGKTHLQHVAKASAINVVRMTAWLDGIPQTKTPTSRFAALRI